jgi:dolichyl-phosphate beta-glucosyltransferase
MTALMTAHIALANPSSSTVATVAAPTVSGPATPAIELPRSDTDDAAQRLQDWANIEVTGRIELSIVIPAYNESKRIVCTIASIAAHVAPRYDNWELVVADDGSRDDTVAKVERLGLANLRVLRAERNGGKGSAVQRGIRAARGATVLFTDADMSTPIAAIGDLLDSISMGADVAVGSRALARDKADRSAIRKVLSFGLRMYQRVLVPTGVQDTQCGFKIFRRDAALEILDHCEVQGFAFDIDMLYTAHRLNMTIDERPVEWVDAPGSKVRPIKDSLAFAKEMLKIRARWEAKHRAGFVAAQRVTGWNLGL